MGEPLSCLQCGKCCFADFTAYAEQCDYDRWHAENRQDILNMIEHRHLVWAGDRLVSTQTGDSPRECPFLYSEGSNWRCSIYETRPLVCRKYQPGSSELCAQFEVKGRRKK
jgi:Fe-S-cluster containining protein